MYKHSEDVLDRFPVVYVVKFGTVPQQQALEGSKLSLEANKALLGDPKLLKAKLAWQKTGACN